MYWKTKNKQAQIEDITTEQERGTRNGLHHTYWKEEHVPA